MMFWCLLVTFLAQAQAPNAVTENIVTTSKGNQDIFLKCGLIVYVSDESGRPQKTGDDCTLINTSLQKVLYKGNPDG